MPALLLLFAMVLPAGERILTKPIELPQGSKDMVVRGKGTTLRMADNFEGAAAIVCRECQRVTVRDLTIVGGKAKPKPIAPWDKAFADYYGSNGILFTNGAGVAVRNVRFRRIPNFAIIVSASTAVQIVEVTVEDGGSRQENGKNNTSGGILLEEGTRGFYVARSTFRRIAGNALWTHSREARNRWGAFVDNSFDTIGRDAIQVGHASSVAVLRNRGRKIGYPVDVVDPNGMPVGIDTAGNVDRARYADNRFEDVNGKCIDLDGFHDGTVANNTCVKMTNFGIVFNNTNAEMQSRKIEVSGNTIDGAMFGGIFVIGEGHTIANNKLLRLNQAHCNETANCIYIAEEPDMLRSGIYFGRKAERPDPAKGNQVRDNVITGYGMAEHCFGYAPGITPQDQTMERNECKP